MFGALKKLANSLESHWEAKGDETEKGKRGETLIGWKLNFVNLFGKKGKILKNLYVPKENGGTSEIDLVYITQKGIFVIESKNYAGWIFGDSKDEKWTVCYSKNRKETFGNPIRQNQTHIKYLKRYLQREIPMFSLIVFSMRCELKNITNQEANITVLQRDCLSEEVRKIWNAQKNVLTAKETEEIYRKLLPLTNVSEEVRQEHIQEIKEALVPVGTCPKCGADVVKGGHGYYCKGKCGMNFTKVYDETLTGEQVLQLLHKKSVLYTYRDSKLVVLPEIAEKVYQNKTYYEWKTKRASTGKTCPRCGAELVVRMARSGEKFYGCRNYPKCNYTQNIK